MSGWSPLYIIPAALLALVAAIIPFTPVYSWLEDGLARPLLFQWRGAVSPPAGVSIVGIDADSTRRLGLPRNVAQWDRRIHARVIRALQDAGAAAIALDIAFREARPDQDAELAKAMDYSGRVVAFKYLRRETRRVEGTGLIMDLETEIAPVEPIAGAAAAVAPFVVPLGAATLTRVNLFLGSSSGFDATQPLVALQVAARPWRGQLLGALAQLAPERARELAAAGAGQGFARGLRGILRERPELGRRALARLQEQEPRPGRRLNMALLRGFLAGDRVYPNFYGPPRSVATVALAQLLSPGASPAPRFDGQVVLVGYSEPVQTEQVDFHRTVFTDTHGASLAGVEISATLAANLLDNRLLRRWSRPLEALLVAGWALALGLAGAAPLRLALALQALAVGALVATAGVAFAQAHLLLPVATPVLVLAPLGLTGTLFSHYRRSQRRHRQVTEALAHYLPREAAEMVGRDLSRLQDRRSLVQGVCLMTDVRGYTEWARARDPTQVHEALNRYYQRLLDAVQAQGGRVANLVGDGMLALWTAPQVRPELAARALRAALAVVGGPGDCPGQRTCAALHGGAFSLGNLGARDHYEFAPVGDIINATAHMESLNRELGTGILVSSELVPLLGEFVLRPVGRFPLKGREQPVALHEVLAVAPNPTMEDLARRTARLVEVADGPAGPAAARLALAALRRDFPDDRFVAQLEARWFPRAAARR